MGIALRMRVVGVSVSERSVTMDREIEIFLGLFRVFLVLRRADVVFLTFAFAECARRAGGVDWFSRTLRSLGLLHGWWG